MDQREKCKKCGLFEHCQSPLMEPYGLGKKGILIVGEAPGSQEDGQGIPFIGPSGRLLREPLDELNVDIDRDCQRTNVIQCYPVLSEPTKKIQNLCKERLYEQINNFQPKLIIALGGIAMTNILCDSPISVTPMKFRGYTVYSRKWNCWVCCSLHPSYFLRDNLDKLFLLKQDLEEGLKHLGTQPNPLIERSGDCNVTISNYGEAVAFFNQLTLLGLDTPVAFDYETTGVSPFEEDAKILTVSFSWDGSKGYCVPVYHSDLWSALERVEIFRRMQNFLTSSIPKICQNTQFEWLWGKAIFDVETNNIIQDTMIGTHILDGRRGITSLDAQVYLYNGDVYGQTLDKKNLINETLEEVAEYNCMDARYTRLLYDWQMEKNLGDFDDALKLFNRGTEALAEMSFEGTRCDSLGLMGLQDDVDIDIVEWETLLTTAKFAKRFEEQYGHPLNLGSNKDLCLLLYKQFGMPVVKRTEKKKDPAVDEDVFTTLKDMVSEKKAILIDSILSWKKAKKVRNTYIENFKLHMDEDGIMHPSMNLHIPETYRSSCNNPNLQNVIKRSEYGKRLRKLIVPKLDLFVRLDFKAAEVRVLASLSKDKNLIQYILDRRDFHKVWAGNIFETKLGDVTSEQRDEIKNGWVFPLFYGSYYKSVAQNMGINEYRAKKLEEKFWKEFDGVKQWQETQVEFYNENHYVRLPTGFRRNAPLNREQIINTPIQGSTFHRLLQGIIDIGEEFKKREMLSHMVLEVHDDLLIDTKEEEKWEVVSILCNEMETKVFDWEIVPMELDLSMGKNWAEMEELEV